MIRKKIRYTIIFSFAFIVCVICAMLYAGCKTQDKPMPAPPEPSNSDITITLNVSLLELHQYETAVINAEVSDGASAKFSSSDETIAAVDLNGTVIAKSAGACDIIVTAKDASAKCRVIVSTSPYKAKIQGVKDEIRIVSGTSFKSALSADYNGTLIDESPATKQSTSSGKNGKRNIKVRITLSLPFTSSSPLSRFSFPTSQPATL